MEVAVFSRRLLAIAGAALALAALIAGRRAGYDSPPFVKTDPP